MLGRIARTLFTPEWIQGNNFRFRIQTILNKDVAKNVLSQVVSFTD
ncbi:hypothetical protein VNTUMSATTG_57490 (plasmid) [Vibrio nigripulchritudo]|nr:hypothetical protein VNTUMSATTG_57490 [Vibrio nigripulchritudo]